MHNTKYLSTNEEASNGMNRDRHTIVILGIAIAISVLMGMVVFQIQDRDQLRIVFFDVGQGDAALIISPSGRTMLIDTGRDGPLISRKLAEYLPWHRPTIDLLLLTHPDLDHVGGAASVIAEYDIGGVLMPYSTKDTALFADIIKEIRERDIPVLFASAGDEVALENALSFSILWPPRLAPGRASPHGGGPLLSANNSSLVGLLLYKNDSFLFTGDLEARGERLLPFFSSMPHAEVLKVGHHGSKTSTSEEFFAEVNPSVTIISVGENSYGHPHEEVLETLRGTTILRTDTNGDITLISNGNNF